MHIAFIAHLDVFKIDRINQGERRFAHHFTSSFRYLGREFEISRRLTSGSGFRMHIVFTAHLDMFRINIACATTREEEGRFADRSTSSINQVINQSIHSNVSGMNIEYVSPGGVLIATRHEWPRVYDACCLYNSSG
jgi:hypothetical protein